MKTTSSFLLLGFLVLSCGSQNERSETVTGSPPVNTVVEDSRVDLSSPGLTVWQEDSGEWLVVGSVELDPSDNSKLIWEDGRSIFVNGPRGNTVDLHSRQEWGDLEAHVEFMVPKGSNSGVYFQSRYEVQIFDSWGVEKPTFSDCGGIYQRWIEEKQEGFEGFPPNVNASKAPGEWQTLDVVFRAPRFDEVGNKIANARFEKVVHNGTLVHQNVEVSGPTRAATFDDERPLGPLMFQGDHGPVAFRNIRVRPL